MKKKTIVITGANGLLGSALCKRFSKEGWTVHAGVRKPRWFLFEDDNIIPFDCHLPEVLEEKCFEDVDACIHAAYITRYAKKRDAWRTNVLGTGVVYRTAKRKKVPLFVFISSCSAHDRALGFYGRSKYFLESKMNIDHDLIVRPGLILGHGGLFARMVKTVRYSKFIPMFDKGIQEVQTIHIEDLVEAIYRAVDRKMTGRLIVAHPDAVPMRDFLRELATCLGYKPKFISFPSKWGITVLQMLEKWNLRISLTSENLLGLRSMAYQDPRESLERLKLSPRATSRSLSDLFSQDAVPGKSLTSHHPQDMKDAV